MPPKKFPLSEAEIAAKKIQKQIQIASDRSQQIQKKKENTQKKQKYDEANYYQEKLKAMFHTAEQEATDVQRKTKMDKVKSDLKEKNKIRQTQYRSSLSSTESTEQTFLNTSTRSEARLTQTVEEHEESKYKNTTKRAGARLTQTLEVHEKIQSQDTIRHAEVRRTQTVEVHEEIQSKDTISRAKTRQSESFLFKKYILEKTVAETLTSCNAPKSISLLYSERSVLSSLLLYHETSGFNYSDSFLKLENLSPDGNMWINDFDVNTNPKSIMDALKEIEEYNQSFRYTTHPFFKARRDAEYLYNILVNMNEYTIYVDMNKMMQKNYDALSPCIQLWYDEQANIVESDFKVSYLKNEAFINSVIKEKDANNKFFKKEELIKLYAVTEYFHIHYTEDEAILFSHIITKYDKIVPVSKMNSETKYKFDKMRDSHKQMYNNMVDSDLLELLKEPTIMQIAEKYAKKKEILQSISSEMDTDEINEEETLIQLAGLTLQDAQALKRIVHNCMYLEKEDVPILLLAMKHLDSYEQKSSDNGDVLNRLNKIFDPKQKILACSSCGECYAMEADRSPNKKDPTGYSIPLSELGIFKYSAQETREYFQLDATLRQAISCFPQLAKHGDTLYHLHPEFVTLVSSIQTMEETDIVFQNDTTDKMEQSPDSHSFQNIPSPKSQSMEFATPESCNDQSSVASPPLYHKPSFGKRNDTLLYAYSDIQETFSQSYQEQNSPPHTPIPAEKEKEQYVANFCLHCFDLLKHDKKNTFCIANGYDYGNVDRIPNANIIYPVMTIAEEMTCSLGRPYSVMINLSLNKQITNRVLLKTHMITFPFSGMTSLQEFQQSILPRTADSIKQTLKVIFTGQATFKQIRDGLLAGLKNAIIRSKVCCDRIKLYKELNVLMRNTNVDYSRIQDVSAQSMLPPDLIQLANEFPDQIATQTFSSDYTLTIHDPIIVRMNELLGSSNSRDIAGVRNDPDDNDDTDDIVVLPVSQTENIGIISDNVLLTAPPSWTGDIDSSSLLISSNGQPPGGKSLKELMTNQLNEIQTLLSINAQTSNITNVQTNTNQSSVLQIGVKPGETTPYNEYTENAELLKRSYPHLFLLGKGVPLKSGEFEKWISHLMRQFNGKHAKNKEFTLLLFDQKSRHIVAQLSGKKIKNNPQAMSRAAELFNSSQMQTDLNAALQDVNGPEAKKVINLVNAITQGISKSIPFTPEERRFVYSLLVALENKFFLPTGFYTCSQDDTNDPYMMRLSFKTYSNSTFPALNEIVTFLKEGDIPPKVEIYDLSSLLQKSDLTSPIQVKRDIHSTEVFNMDIPFKQYHKKRIAELNPIQTSKLFIHYQKILFEEIFGMPYDSASIKKTYPRYDESIGDIMKTSLSNQFITKFPHYSNGLHQPPCGQTLAAVAIMEESSRVALHTHATVWTTQGCDSLMAVADHPYFLNRFYSIIDSIFKTEIPAVLHLTTAVLYEIAGIEKPRMALRLPPIYYENDNISETNILKFAEAVTSTVGIHQHVTPGACDPKAPSPLDGHDHCRFAKKSNMVNETALVELASSSANSLIIEIVASTDRKHSTFIANRQQDSSKCFNPAGIVMPDDRCKTVETKRRPLHIPYMSNDTVITNLSSDISHMDVDSLPFSNINNVNDSSDSTHLNYYDYLITDNTMGQWGDLMIKQIENAKLYGNSKDQTFILTDSEKLAFRNMTVPLAKTLREVLINRNGYVVDYNTTAASVLRCNTAFYFLGSTSQCIAIFIYLAEYITKEGFNPKDSLASIAKAKDYIRKYPTLPIGNETQSERNLKKFMQRILNSTDSGTREIPDTTASLGVLGGKAHVCTHNTSYVFGYDTQRIVGIIQSNVANVPIYDNTNVNNQEDENEGLDNDGITDDLYNENYPKENEIDRQTFGSVPLYTKSNGEKIPVSQADFYKYRVNPNYAIEATKKHSLAYQNLHNYVFHHWPVITTSPESIEYEKLLLKLKIAKFYVDSNLIHMNIREFACIVKVEAIKPEVFELLEKEMMSPPNYLDLMNDNDIDDNNILGDDVDSQQKGRYPARRLLLHKDHPLYDCTCLIIGAKQKITMLGGGKPPVYPVDLYPLERPSTALQNARDSFAKYTLSNYWPFTINGFQQIMNPNFIESENEEYLDLTYDWMGFCKLLDYFYSDLCSFIDKGRYYEIRNLAFGTRDLPPNGSMNKRMISAYRRQSSDDLENSKNLNPFGIRRGSASYSNNNHEDNSNDAAAINLAQQLLDDNRVSEAGNTVALHDKRINYTTSLQKTISLIFEPLQTVIQNNLNAKFIDPFAILFNPRKECVLDTNTKQRLITKNVLGNIYDNIRTRAEVYKVLENKKTKEQILLINDLERTLRNIGIYAGQERMDLEVPKEIAPYSVYTCPPEAVDAIKNMLKYSQGKEPNLEQIQVIHRMLTSTHPLRLLMVGQPGTGKTYTLSLSQQVKHVPLVFTAVSGSAASNLPGGKTLCNFFGYNPKRRYSDPKQKSPIPNLSVSNQPDKHTNCIRLFEEYHGILAIDEVSMLHAVFLGHINNTMKSFPVDMNSRLQPFGNYDIILTGDFHQTPPIGGKSIPDMIYRILIEPHKIKTPDDDIAVEGALVFMTFEKHELKINQRALQDPSHMERINSMSNYTQPHPINQKLIDYFESIQLKSDALMNDPSWLENGKILTGSNIERFVFNQFMVKLDAQRKQSICIQYPLKCSAAFSGVFTDAEFNYVQSIYPELSGYFLIGAPCTLTENIKPEKGLSNGTDAICHSLVFDENDPLYEETIQKIASALPGSCIQINIAPTYFIVEVIPNAALDIPDDEFISSTISTPRYPNRVCVPIKNTSGTKTDIVKTIIIGDKVIKDYKYYISPAEISYSVTFEKAQGKTLPKVILCLHKNPWRSLILEHIYVGFTRVENSSNLAIWPSDKLELSRFLKFKHPDSLILLELAYDQISGKFDKKLYMDAYTVLMKSKVDELNLKFGSGNKNKSGKGIRGGPQLAGRGSRVSRGRERVSGRKNQPSALETNTNLGKSFRSGYKKSSGRILNRASRGPSHEKSTCNAETSISTDVHDASALNNTQIYLHGVSEMDIKIVKLLEPNLSSFPIGQPDIDENFSIQIGEIVFPFRRYNYHVSLIPYISFGVQDRNLLDSREAIETNRCFLIHLGIALKINPFLLKVAFQHLSAVKLRTPEIANDIIKRDFLNTLHNYSGFIDAHVCLDIWPIEFNQYRILFIKQLEDLNTPPLFFSFRTDVNPINTLTDVIIYCHHSHFTILEPQNIQENQAIHQLLLCVAREHLIFQDFIVTDYINPADIPNQPNTQPSIQLIIDSIQS